MPSVLRFNARATEAAQRKIAEALGGPGSKASESFASFIRDLGLPGRLSEVGVSRGQFKLISENAMLSPFTRSNPRKINGPEDIMEILTFAA